MAWGPWWPEPWNARRRWAPSAGLPAQADLDTLNGGAATLARKSAELAVGVTRLQTGAAQLATGAADADAGAIGLENGLDTLYN